MQLDTNPAQLRTRQTIHWGCRCIACISSIALLRYTSLAETVRVCTAIACVLPCVQYLPRADLVLVLLEGRIAHMGTYQQLTASGVDLSAFVPQHTTEDEQGQQQQSKVSQPAQQAGFAGGGSLGTAGDGQQQQQHTDVRSLLAADSQQLGSRPPDTAAQLAAQQLQQQQGLSGAVLESSGSSAVQLVQLPSFYTKSLLATGGSFASHVPVKVGGGEWQCIGGRKRPGEGKEVHSAVTKPESEAMLRHERFEVACRNMGCCET